MLQLFCLCIVKKLKVEMIFTKSTLLSCILYTRLENTWKAILKKVIIYLQNQK